MNQSRHEARYKVAIAAAALAWSCGGDGGGGGAEGPLTLRGTAASGAPLAGATVRVVCAAGEGEVTSSGDGAFSLSLSGGEAPCALEVSAGDVSLHAWANAAGTINLTPLTDAVVGIALRGDPAALVSAFDPAALDGGALAQAEQKLLAYLASQGIDVSAVTGSVLTQPFAADHTGLDALLDLLAERGFTAESMRQGTLAANPASDCAPSTLAAFNEHFGGQRIEGTVYAGDYGMPSGMDTLVLGDDGTAGLVEAGTLLVFTSFCSYGANANFPYQVGSSATFVVGNDALPTLYGQFMVGNDGKLYVNDLTIDGGKLFSNAIVAMDEPGPSDDPKVKALADAGFVGETFAGATVEGLPCTFAVGSDGALRIGYEGTPMNPSFSGAMLQRHDEAVKAWDYDTLAPGATGMGTQARLKLEDSPLDGEPLRTAQFGTYTRTDTSLNVAQLVVCSTDNSSARRATLIAPFVGSWSGVDGASAACSATVAADGAITFTRVNSGVVGGAQTFSANLIDGHDAAGSSASITALTTPGPGLALRGVGPTEMTLPQLYGGGVVSGTSYLTLKTQGSAPAYAGSELNLLFVSDDGATTTGSDYAPACTGMSRQ